MPEAFVAIALILTFLVIMFYITKMRVIKRLKYLNGLLTVKRDPDLFLREIDVSINKQRKAPYRSTLNILKAKGLIWKGDWQSCVDILNGVSQSDILNDFNSAMRDYDMVLALFNSGKRSEALRIIEENTGFFNKNINSPNKFIVNPIKKIYALKDFYEENYVKSEERFKELNILQPDDFSKAINHYYLGLIDTHNGNLESARENFKSAAELGGSTYLPDLVGRKLEEMDQ